MKNYYLVISLLFLFASGAVHSQWNELSSPGPKVVPFEDYSKCQVGFIKNGFGKKDTIFRARFENLTPIGIAPERFYVNQGQGQIRFEGVPGWILSENGKFGFITAEGKISTPFQYDNLEYFQWKNAFLARKNGKYGLVTFQDSILVPITYDTLYLGYMNFYTDLVSPVGLGGLYGMFGSNGKEMVPPLFDSIEPIMVQGKEEHQLFFVVKKNNQFGLMDDDSKWVVPMRYQHVEIINGNSPAKAVSFFSALDSLGYTTVFDETGKQIGESMLGNYYPIYSKILDDYPAGCDFIGIQDTAGTKRTILSAFTGKYSPFHETISLYRNHMFYGSHEFWQGTMDTSFQVIASTDAPRKLYYFEVHDQHLREIQDYSDLYDTEPSFLEVKMKKQRFSSFHEPNAVVMSLEKPRVKLRKKEYLSETEYFALWNLETGKQTPFVYNEIHRMISSTDGVYFWAVHNHSEDVRFVSQDVSIDIYDSSGVLVNSICLDRMEYEKAVYENSDHPFGVLLVQNQENEWTVLCADGTRLSKTYLEHSRDYSSQPWIYREHGKHDGIIQINVLNGLSFMDYYGKPLLDGRIFLNTTFRQITPGYNCLKDSSGYIIVRDDLSIVMDSCSTVVAIDQGLSYSLKSYFNYVIIKKGSVYCIRDGAIQAVDSTLFLRPFEKQRLAKDLWIDTRGNVLQGTDEEHSAQMYPCGNLFIGKFGTTLRIEDKHRKFIMEIPNVKQYHPSTTQLTVVTTAGKTGKFRNSTMSWIIPPIFAEINGTNAPGIFFARDSAKEKWCLIDSLGNRKTANLFDDVFTFSLGRRHNQFYSNSKIGIIDRNFEIVMPARFNMGLQLRRSYVFRDQTGYYLLRDTSASVFKLEDGFVDSDQFNQYLYVKNDSVWVRDREGNLLLPPTLRSYVEQHVNLAKYFFPEMPYGSLPQIHGLFLSCRDTDTALIRINTALLLAYADRNIVDQKQLGRSNKVEYKPGNACFRRPMWTNEHYYSERLDGSCNIENGVEKQDHGYNTFDVTGDSAVLLNWRDLFANPTEAEVEISALIEKQIQQLQLFGTTCGDMPAAVAEIKRNFYLSGANIYFMYLPKLTPVIVQLNQVKSPLKHPEYLPIPKVIPLPELKSIRIH